MNYIDLRSDTVTKPSEGMRKAMYNAEVGDDVYKEDPTVNELEEYFAHISGHEAALFVMSGVMGNQICLNLNSRPMDEVICESDSHIFHYESGTPAFLSGLTLNPVKGEFGILEPRHVEAAIRPREAYYMPRTRILSIENTHNRGGGTVYPSERITALKQVADKHRLHFHLDGARVWNAAVYSGCELKEITAQFDTVSCCLSKGLGAPVGSIIAGSKDFIKEAFRLRKAIGGGARQLGILAAAGRYALENNISRLAEDHEKAAIIADAIYEFHNIHLERTRIQTNMVIFSVTGIPDADFTQKCRDKGLLISGSKPGELRMVTHMDVTFEQINKAVEILRSILEGIN